MILFTNGCSWTYGGGLNLDDAEQTEERLKSVWPAHLGRMLGVHPGDVYNFAIGCGSNQRTVRTTYDYLNNSRKDSIENTIFVIQLTEASRFEYYEPGKNHWARAKIDAVIQKSEEYPFAIERVNRRLETYTDEEGRYALMSSVLTLTKLFELYNVKNYFFWTLPPNRIINNDLLAKNDEHWVCLDNRRTGESAWKYDIVGMTPAGLDKHPSKVGHQRVAEIIYDKIFNRLK
jgi:hypothetical protein